MTGGTGGSEGHLWWLLATAGVGTIVGMAIYERNLEKAREAHVNVVIAGHMASDSIGINLILDELVRRGIDVVPCSGLIRVARI